MTNETPQPVLADSTCQPRRRSMRLTSPKDNIPNSAPTDAVKRHITVRKIAPRKTQVNVPSEDHTENERRLIEGSPKKSQIYTPGPAQVPTPKATMLSPILAPSPPCPQAAANPEDSAWSQKVRRSYTRLSLGDPSFESHQAMYSPSPQRRETLFGFEKLSDTLRFSVRLSSSGWALKPPGLSVESAPSPCWKGTTVLLPTQSQISIGPGVSCGKGEEEEEEGSSN